MCLTANPFDSSQLLSSAIWVERPDPSGPSITTSRPANFASRTSGGRRPKNFFSIRGMSEDVRGRESTGSRLKKRRKIDPLANQAAHFILLLLDLPGGVDHREAERFDHFFVFLLNLPLKDPETFIRIDAPSHI